MVERETRKHVLQGSSFRIEIERDDLWRFDEQPIFPGLSQLRMALSMADVSDCVHRVTIPTCLGAWFCLPHSTAGEMELDLSSGALGLYDLVFPCPSRFLLGFSWSVYLCQCAGEALFKRATRLARCPLVNDRDQAPIFHESSGRSVTTSSDMSTWTTKVC